MRVRHPDEHVDLVAEHRLVPRIAQERGRQVLDGDHFARTDPAGQDDPSLGTAAQLVQLLEPA
jgi:hypothetical protein